MSEDVVTVPTLVGLDLVDASALASASGVVVVAADPDEELPVTGVVVSQDPPAGTAVTPGYPVAIALGGGGDDRDREPAPVRLSGE